MDEAPGLARARRRLWAARWHRRLGLVAAPLIAVEAVTVLLLNHQSLYYDRATKQGAAGLLRLAYNLHDGWFWGQPLGVVLTDAVALALLALLASGFSLWWWSR